MTLRKVASRQRQDDAMTIERALVIGILVVLFIFAVRTLL